MAHAYAAHSATTATPHHNASHSAFAVHGAPAATKADTCPPPPGRQVCSWPPTSGSSPNVLRMAQGNSFCRSTPADVTNTKRFRVLGHALIRLRGPSRSVGRGPLSPCHLPHAAQAHEHSQLRSCRRTKLHGAFAKERNAEPTVAWQSLVVQPMFPCGRTCGRCTGPKLSGACLRDSQKHHAPAYRASCLLLLLLLLLGA
jgi:hypothetical protein